MIDAARTVFTAPIPQLRTERLHLRPFVAADAPAVELFAGAREVADATLTIPHPYPTGGAVRWIGTHAGDWRAGERLTFAICLAAPAGDLVGAISLAIAAEHAHGELGYWIGLPMWGRGYATEAARAVVSFGFESIGLHRIHARHFVRNPASGRVMQKLGMRFEGVNRDAFRRWDRFEDVAVYAILAPEWQRPEGAAAAAAPRQAAGA